MPPSPVTADHTPVRFKATPPGCIPARSAPVDRVVVPGLQRQLRLRDALLDDAVVDELEEELAALVVGLVRRRRRLHQRKRRPGGEHHRQITQHRVETRGTNDRGAATDLLLGNIKD